MVEEMYYWGKGGQVSGLGCSKTRSRYPVIKFMTRFIKKDWDLFNR